MKLVLYSCDICGKEHRRFDIIEIAFIKNGEQVKCRDHLCSVCETKISDFISDMEKNAKDIIGGEK